MKVNEMKIADVLVTNEYYKNIKNIIANLRHIREDARKESNNILLRHVMDRLEERGVFEPEQMTQLYAEVMDRKLQGYSSEERRYIRQVGGAAFNLTMEKLLDEEKKNNGNGND